VEFSRSTQSGPWDCFGRGLRRPRAGEKEPLDVVIANAVVMATPFGYTTRGFDGQFEVLVGPDCGPHSDGRTLIIVSSAGHRRSDVHLEESQA
jgi:hypothetical protein